MSLFECSHYLGFHIPEIFIIKVSNITMLVNFRTEIILRQNYASSTLLSSLIRFLLIRFSSDLKSFFVFSIVITERPRGPYSQFVAILASFWSSLSREIVTTWEFSSSQSYARIWTTWTAVFLSEKCVILISIF